MTNLYKPVDIPALLMDQVAEYCYDVCEYKLELLPGKPHSVCRIKTGGLVAFYQEAGVFGSLAIFAPNDERTPVLHITTTFTCRERHPVNGWRADLNLAISCPRSGRNFYFADQVQTAAKKLLESSSCNRQPVWIGAEPFAPTTAGRWVERKELEAMHGVGQCAY